MNPLSAAAAAFVGAVVSVVLLASPPYGLVRRYACLVAAPSFSDGHAPRAPTVLERIGGIGHLIALGVAAVVGIWAVRRWRRRHPLRLEGKVSK